MATSANPHNNHGGGVFTPVGPTHNLPYEPDRPDIKPILAVPIAVIVTTILAYVATQLIFDHVFSTSRDENKYPSDSPIAAEFGKKPLTERLKSISSTDPNAEVKQPRLEEMRTRAQAKRDGAYPITAELTTQQPLKNDPSNSPAYHPEDLRAERSKELNTYSQKEGGPVQIPIAKAMELLVKGNLLPSGKKSEPLPTETPWDRAKESNGGVPSTERK